jgi:predicted nuclease of predicted toxin-antitoxin system
VRLLLDAHLSPKRIGVALRAAGHDVLALAEHPELEALTDAQVLEFAVEERRVLVTRNAKDFAPLLRAWAEAGRHHHGCILIWGIRTDRFGEIVRRVGAQLEEVPSPAGWRDLVVAL